MILAPTCGFFLGLLFFGGLWWTVNRLHTWKNPGLWILASFCLRTAAVLGGLYFVSRGSVENILMSLVGFLIARSVVIRLSRARTEFRKPSNAH